MLGWYCSGKTPPETWIILAKNEGCILLDGLDKAVNWQLWGNHSACSLLGTPGDRAHPVYTIVLLGSWYLKGHLLVTLWKSLLCTFIVHVSQETELLMVSVLALQGLILDSFHFVGLDRTDFQQI